MTLEEINLRVRRIQRIKADDEVAHSEEDKLWGDFIAYVATLDIPLAAKAKAVLATKNINFSRWCA